MAGAAPAGAVVRQVWFDELCGNFLLKTPDAAQQLEEQVNRVGGSKHKLRVTRLQASIGGKSLEGVATKKNAKGWKKFDLNKLQSGADGLTADEQLRGPHQHLLSDVKEGRCKLYPKTRTTTDRNLKKPEGLKGDFQDIVRRVGASQPGAPV